MAGAWDAGRTHSGALPVALRKANRYLALYDYHLDYVWRDSQCDAGKSLAAMSQLLDMGVDAFIGPGCSLACEPTQLLASNRNVLQVFIAQYLRK